jgi:hypothetical protein
MEPHGEVEVKIRSSLTLALMGVNGQLQASAGLPSESIDYDSVVSRAALKALEKTKTSLSLSLCRQSNEDYLAFRLSSLYLGSRLVRGWLKSYALNVMFRTSGALQGLSGTRANFQLRAIQWPRYASLKQSGA